MNSDKKTNLRDLFGNKTNEKWYLYPLGEQRSVFRFISGVLHVRLEAEANNEDVIDEVDWEYLKSDDDGLYEQTLGIALKLLKRK